MSSKVNTRSRVLAATLDLIGSAKGPISMSNIAVAAGLSRQALYLLFADRTDLFVGLLRYADGQRGLVEEIAAIRDAPSGIEALKRLIDMQARLNPDHKKLVDAFEVLRRQDPAAEAAWQDRLSHRLAGCRAIVARLGEEGQLDPDLDDQVAVDLIWSLTSVATWDDLVVSRGWTADQYRKFVLRLAEAALVR